MIIKRLNIIGFVLLSLILLKQNTCLADENLVKIGVLAKRGTERCLEEWTPTADYLADNIPGMTFEIVPLNHEQIYTSVENGEVDFVLANSSIYVELEINCEINRIATLVNRCLGDYCYYTNYWGVIFCKKSRTDMRSLRDLKNKTFMAVEESSFGGWRMAWRELKDYGINPYKDFKVLCFGGTHDAVIYAVRDGKVDAGTARADTFERMRAEGEIDINDFYVFHQHLGKEEDLPFPHSTRGYPEWPFAVVKHTSDELAKKVVIALLQMPEHSLPAIAANCGGWTTPLNYQPVRDCLKELKVGPYKDLGKITLSDVFRKYRYWILIAGITFLLMTGFIIMILKLNRDIKASQVKLRAEIIEHERAEIELIKAKEAAEAAAVAKSEFLANMSHEIRTPMHGVIAATELALNEEIPPRTEHYLELIQSSAYSLLGIINDILDFSKIEAEKLGFETRPFRLDEVIDRSIDMFINKASEKRIEIVVDIDLDTPKALIGDPLRLQQIITNLISNAVKFTGEDGVILIGVKASEKTLERAALTFFVKDTGVGIAEKDIKKLFVPFSQVDASSTRKYEGTGLGLTICKQLVEKMGGTIWVKSEFGKGSTFTFTANFGRQSTEEKKYVPPPDIQGLNVLVVDDCADSRLIMEKMLESFGFRVELVSSGEDSLTVLKDNQSLEKPFGLVMMDWLMPGLDGIETSRKIRQELKLTIPIIMMTAFGKDSERLEAEKAGINVFLTKPIYQSTLFNSIMDAFGKEAFISTVMEKRITTKASIYKKRLKGIRILVAEDNPTNQEIARAILESAGISVEIARNGKEAVEAARRSHFDAALMDIQMPEMDGYEATKIIREDSRFTSIPIIAMTAHAMKGDEEKCLEAGMDGYISKPINQERLFYVIWKSMRLQVPLSAKVHEVVSKETVVAKAGDLPARLPGINIEDALRLLNIDKDIFKSILIKFLKRNKDTMSKIRSAFESKDLGTLVQLAHNLQGSAGNIGADELHNAAMELEIASKEASIKPPTLSLIDELGTSLDKVLASLETLVDDSESKALHVSGKTLDKPQFKQELRQLADALKAADPEVIIEQMKKVREHADSLILQELENQINNYDYDEALESINRILNIDD
ncbi:MAG: response regulator [Proteobacteria bacterium]|nr:response regulator [Pseudomonadota bacterium]